MLGDSRKRALDSVKYISDYSVDEDGDKDYKSMFPCYYVEKIDEVKECA